MIRIREFRTAVVVLAALATLSLPALGQEGLEDLGTFKDWQARSYKEGGKLVCTMFSVPTASEGDYTNRGEVYVFVTHRPAHNRTDEVSINIGYTFKKGAPVNVVISGTTHELFSDRSTAWTRDSKADRALVQAMRAGAEMIVQGVSGRGTRTTDTFSLSGFSAAHNAITSACRVR
ncbi:MAG: invasion associated locus B family protein [Alphaproteobacteria bacterium]|nr:invasion associated locus B family protein [Alphaproteobacteria bacterium]